MEDVQKERSDADIIQEILEGNVNAFELLMGRYQGYVAGIVIKHVPQDRTEEIAHEAFIRAYRSLRTFKAKTPFKHWLASIAVRCCHDFWRRHYRRKETSVSSISEDGWEWIQTLRVNGSADASDGYTRNPEALRVLRWAMEGLSADHRTVLTLDQMAGNTPAEAAELLHWSVPKVKIRAYRARKKLRKTLSDAIPGM
jgi:RNA polymerase sigma-70 factor (ECF subfamily)